VTIDRLDAAWKARSVRKLAILAALVALTTSCGSGSSKETTIDDAQNGSSVALHPRDFLVVKLLGHEDGGYRWELQHTDPAVARLIDKSHKAADVPPNVYGASGTYSFRFRAVAPGTETLKLLDVRSFERAHPAGSYQVTITVR
jgi:predicted secreted protein